MFAKLFGFRGRLGRLSYFGWTALAAVFWSIWLFAVFAGLMAGLAKGSLGALFGSALVAVVGVVPVVWMFLALATKRARDAGFPPILVLPPVIAFSLFDAFVLSRHAGGQPLGAFVHSTPTGLAVNFVFSLLLLFWPSAGATGDGDEGENQRPAQTQWHQRALTLAASPPPQQAPEPYRSQTTHGQPRTFGRRTA